MGSKVRRTPLCCALLLYGPIIRSRGDIVQHNTLRKYRCSFETRMFCEHADRSRGLFYRYCVRESSSPSSSVVYTAGDNAAIGRLYMHEYFPVVKRSHNRLHAHLACFQFGNKWTINQSSSSFWLVPFSSSSSAADPPWLWQVALYRWGVLLITLFTGCSHILYYEDSSWRLFSGCAARGFEDPNWITFLFKVL